jgi:hypothetical protein
LSTFCLGRFAIVESDSSESVDEIDASDITDRLSIISDDADWSKLADDVKDILRMKKVDLRRQAKLLQQDESVGKSR